ncbi:MAG: inorganic diphosphatase [Halobacteriales archaeon]
MANLWSALAPGANPPDEITVVVECVKGQRNKYEYDKDIPAIKLDRVLFSNVHYPGDYGFIPQTWYDDDDPLDVLVLVEDPTFPGCVIDARPIALMTMLDDDEQDDKVIAVPSEDPRWDHVRDLEDVTPQQRDEIGEFFGTYKNLEPGKETAVQEWRDRSAARAAIGHAVDLYEDEFGAGS